MRMRANTVRLLVAAGVLMVLSGCIFASVQRWLYAVLMWVGAFDCVVAALNLKYRKDE